MGSQFVLFVFSASRLRVVCLLCEWQVIFHCCVIFHCVTILRFVYSSYYLSMDIWDSVALGQCSPGERPVQFGRQPCVALMSHLARPVCHGAPVTGEEGQGCPGWWAYQLLVLREGRDRENHQRMRTSRRCVFQNTHLVSVQRAVLAVASMAHPMGHRSPDPQSSSWLIVLTVILTVFLMNPHVTAGV